MSVLQRVVGWTGTLELFVLFAVLVVRGHHRRAPMFTVFVAGTALGCMLLGIEHTQQNWIRYNLAVAALRFGVAVELTYRIFGSFPAAALTARRVMFVLLLVTASVLMSVSGPAITYTQFTTVIVPRLATGTVWILTALAALVLWYRLPLGVLQRAILMGLAPYLIVSSVAMNLIGSIGWKVADGVAYVDALSFMALVGYWCWVAWGHAAEAAPLRGFAFARAMSLGPPSTGRP